VTELFFAYQNVIDTSLLNALLALGCFLLLGVNLFSLGTGGLMAIGAYTSVWLTMQQGCPFPLALAAGSAAATIAAFGLGALVLRLRGDYFAMATLAFSEVVRIIALNWDSVTGGALGIFGIPQQTQTWQLAVALAVVTYLIWAVRRSEIGRRMRAVAADELAMGAAGHDVVRLKLALFSASGAIAGLGGGFAAHLNSFVSPGDFGFLRSVDSVVAPVLGGAWNLAGPWIGATILTVLPEAFRFSAQMREVLVGAAVLAAVLFLPGGIASLARSRKRSVA
jgi:branched-chain amino acid transport system permease protein